MSRLRPITSLLPAICLLGALLAASNLVPTSDSNGPRLSAGGPDILVIIVDDLNHWVGHLGRNRAISTPNIDLLAARGVTFTAAYSPAPVCNPSRAAFLSGLRPSTSGVYGNTNQYWRHIPLELTLPSFFRRHGYRVVGAGKLYHGGAGRPEEWDAYFQPDSDQIARPRRRSRQVQIGSIRWAELVGREGMMEDHHVVNWCIDRLEEAGDRPLFLACGLRRPHLPWSVPKRFFKQYPLANVEPPPFLEEDLDDVPGTGLEFADAAGDHAAIVEAGVWEQAIRAYQAAVSYADAEVGRLLEALAGSPRAEDTVIVLMGDHGWHLGEKHHWRKSTLWEEGTRTPYIWVVPGTTDTGGASRRTVDLMSLYPTLAEVAGLPIPGHVEGISIRPLLIDPEAPWGVPALSTFGYRNHAVRSEKWRYIRYADGGEELYDEERDPYEWANLADAPEYAALKAELADWMPARNRRDPQAGLRARRAREGRSAD